MEIYIDVTLFIFFYLVINQKSSPLQIPQKRSSNSQVQHQSAVGRNFQIPGCMKSNASSKKVKAGLLHNFLQNLRAMSYINFQNKHIYICIYIHNKARAERRRITLLMSEINHLQQETNRFFGPLDVEKHS